LTGAEDANDPPEMTGFSRTQWTIVWLLFSMIVLNYLDRIVLSVVSPVMRQELALSEVDYAWALNAFLLAYGVMYLGSGLILDRIGSRAGLAIFVAVWSLASSLHGLTTGLWSLMMFRFVLGLAEPGGWTGAVKTVAERFPTRQRGLASGIFTSGAGLGAIIAPPLVVWLSLHYGWRTAFWISGVAGILWVPAWLAFTRAGTEFVAAPRSGLRIRELILDRRALAYCVTRFFGDSSGYFFLFWLPEYLVNSKRFSLAAVGMLAWIPFLFQDAGAILGGYWSGGLIARRRPPLLARKIAMTLAGVFVILGTLLHSASSAPIVILSTSLCTFGVGVWAANMHSVPMDAFPHSKVASVHGLAGSAGAAGGIVFNWLVSSFTSQGNYGLAFLVLATLQPFGVAALWLGMPSSRSNATLTAPSADEGEASTS
jgi:ACS family hexuronate transporter-like MFS transporter